jgi:hypothetical protein
MITSPKRHPASRFLHGLLCALLVVGPLQKLKAEQPGEAIQQAPAPDLGSAPFQFLRELERVQKALSSSGDQISVAGRVRDDSGKHVKFIVRNIEVIEPQ